MVIGSGYGCLQPEFFQAKTFEELETTDKTLLSEEEIRPEDFQGMIEDIQKKQDPIVFI